MHNKKGSIVFIVLMFIITLSAITYSLLRTHTYSLSIAREREQYEKAYQLAQSLADVIMLEYDHHADNDNNTVHGAQKVLFKGLWPSSTSKYHAKAWLEIKNNDLHVELRRNKKTIIHLMYPQRRQEI